MPNHRMDFWNLTIKIIFLSQTTAGVLGNFSLISYYLFHCGERILKPRDLIFVNLMAANALVVLSTGVPHTMAALGLKKFLNEIGCRLVLYIERVARSVSISTTCLLSVFQAFTIRRKESCCKDQKLKDAKYIGCYIFSLWFLYLLVNFFFCAYTLLKRHNKNLTGNQDFGYCFIGGYDELNGLLYAVLVLCPEIFFSVVISWSSSSMIVILYRHKQRVQHIHNTHVSSRNSPESRATKNILTLVSTFLAFYTLSSILRGCISLLYTHTRWLVNITHLTSLCFPSFGPFVLMNHYSVMPRLSLVWIRNKTC
ncbi:vomeronasal type-1 receptor 4-like [Acomys russatus]|uniref:vomeronasal type-1 receptor 4-like n=1 Tax=Acomys russatus TaxID=60746 RepID=UPI0021E27ECD|nr:vomeronasal type-1 receptor 4-like [Acomys russatus]